MGTIPFEAALQGKKAFAFDLSPTAHVISNAKLRIKSASEANPVIDDLENYIKEYKPSPTDLEEARSFGFNGKLVEYYHPQTLKEIIAARAYFHSKNRVICFPYPLY